MEDRTQVIGTEVEHDAPSAATARAPRPPRYLIALALIVAAAAWYFATAGTGDPDDAARSGIEDQGDAGIFAVDAVLGGPAGVRDIAVGTGATAGTFWMAAPNGVWILSESGGIDSWNHYTIRQGLPPAPIEHIEIAPDGAVWVANSSGVAVLQDGRWAGDTSGDSPTGAYALALGPDGSVWAGWDAVYRFADGSWTKFSEPVSDVPPGSDPIVTEIEAGGLGVVWAAVTNDLWQPETGALYRLEGGQWNQVPLPVDDRGLVTALTVGLDGSPWIAFDPIAGDTVIAHLEDDGWEVLDAFEADIQELALGADGALWLASEGSDDKASWRGVIVRDGESTQRFLGGISVATVLPSVDGATWIGGDGLYRIDTRDRASR